MGKIAIPEYEQEPGISLLAIGNRVYRKTTLRARERSQRASQPVTSTSTSSTKTAAPAWHDDDSAEDTDEPIEQHDDGSVSLKFLVPSALMGFLIGKGGKQRTTIERETRTTITIPQKPKGAASTTLEETVLIKGQTSNAVISAKTRCDLILASARDSQPYTHFLSLPLNDKALQDRVQELYSYALQHAPPIEGMHQSITVSSTQLHLTIAMLKLFSRSELDKATQVLKAASGEIYDLLGTRTLLLNLAGLEYMTDDPRSVDVMYLGVREASSEGGTDRLRAIAKLLVDSFFAAGLIKEPDYDFKPHVTVFNTRHRFVAQDSSGARSASGGGRAPPAPRIPFDATALLNSPFSSESFGQIRIPAIHLSERGKFDADGYYHCVTKISLP